MRSLSMVIFSFPKKPRLVVGLKVHLSDGLWDNRVIELYLELRFKYGC